MKVTIVNKKKKKNITIFPTIVMLFLGIILTFNSKGLLTGIFTFLGVLVLIYGIFKLIRFYQLKNQFKVEEQTFLVSGITSICTGLLVILLSNFITNAISIITGVWLIALGCSKINDALCYKTSYKNRYIISIISAFILFLLGLYTILADNVILVFIGIILIIYAGYSLFEYFFN